MGHPTHSHQKGFTLIELAVVIAIIAILAAVALPRFGNTAAQAELANIKDLKSQLASAYAIYTAENAKTPAGFTDFVTSATTTTSPQTLALGKFGTNSGTPASRCSIAATSISCPGAFNNWSASYQFNGGEIGGAAVKKGTNTLPNADF
jgi:type IV pilus assembly protein PilA